MASATTRLRLRVSPGAGRAAVVGRHGDAWKVRVTEAPERGRANEAATAALGAALGVKTRDIAIVAGKTARDKLVSVHGNAKALALLLARLAG